MVKARPWTAPSQAKRPKSKIWPLLRTFTFFSFYRKALKRRAAVLLLLLCRILLLRRFAEQICAILLCRAGKYFGQVLLWMSWSVQMASTPPPPEQIRPVDLISAVS